MQRKNEKPLFAEERKTNIVSLIKERKIVTVPELCDYFKVSPATIRNDLSELEKVKLIKRTHGGAIDVSKAGYEPSFSEKKVKNQDLKKIIAEEALKFIEDGDIIILDAGTTTFELARLLESREYKNLTVVINDIAIAQYLEEIDGINMILIGGTVRKGLSCTVGPLASKMLSELNVDKVFLATNGFTVEKGCTTPDVNQAEIKGIMVDIASKVIVLSDSTKFGNTSFAQFASPSSVDILITDDGLTKEWTKNLKNEHYQLIIAEG